MDKRFQYRKKNVHDIHLKNGLIRLWSADGTGDKKVIEKSFERLFRSGFVYPYAALMPDYHPGEGSMIGSVIPTRDVLLPTVMGGDLGCGMTACRVPIAMNDLMPRLGLVRDMIKERVPTGDAYNTDVTPRVQENPIWGELAGRPWPTRNIQYKALRQFGSLGAGNHFIEIQADDEGQIWIMLHSGSRFLGIAIRDYYVKRGRQESGVNGSLYAKLSYIAANTPLATDYVRDVTLAVDFAKESRKEMMLRALEVFRNVFETRDSEKTVAIGNTAHDMAHNYVAAEDHFGETLFVHRKGAIRVGEGELGLIPGSMGTSSYVVKGRGNKHSFCSCSHGAGRAMSRKEAFKQISEKDFLKSMQGIVFDRVGRNKDEAPAAYKDISRVMRAQKDIVRIVNSLRPLASIKGF
jgi:tRNA-splicing ligase RtcB